MDFWGEDLMGKWKLLPGLELGRTVGPGGDGPGVRLGADRRGKEGIEKPSGMQERGDQAERESVCDRHVENPTAGLLKHRGGGLGH